jgi:hypothetical protein
MAVFEDACRLVLSEVVERAIEKVHVARKNKRRLFVADERAVIVALSEHAVAIRRNTMDHHDGLFTIARRVSRQSLVHEQHQRSGRFLVVGLKGADAIAQTVVFALKLDGRCVVRRSIVPTSMHEDLMWVIIECE